MSNLKKTALAVIALGSTAAFAGTMGPVCSAVNVTVPCENTAWDLGGRALYLQPSLGGITGQNTVTAGTFNGGSLANTITLGKAPSYNWGFQFEGSYHFNTGNDFNVNWYHFRGSNSSTLVPTAAQVNALNSITPFDFVGVTTTGLSNIYQASSSDWDQVNMEFGQHVDFGENKFARFHAGMQFARVAASTTLNLNNVSGTYGANSTPFTGNFSFIPSTVYNGFGPRVGSDLTYDWGNGLSVYGTGALGLLAGSAKESIQPTLGTATTLGISTSSARVVPTLDAKLGFMYTYAMAQGDLSFDIGWLWNQYIGALTSANFDGQTAQSENFGIQGLYFGLKWVGNVA